jgi:hypothetical protein
VHAQDDGVTRERWTAVDRYITDLLVPSDAALDAALAASAAAGLPPHDVSPSQGKLLFLLASLQGARTILEIGTLGGYSTIWLARALPAGCLITLNRPHAPPSPATTSPPGSGTSSVRVGRALDSCRYSPPRSRSVRPGLHRADKQVTRSTSAGRCISRASTVIVVDRRPGRDRDRRRGRMRRCGACAP